MASISTSRHSAAATRVTGQQQARGAQQLQHAGDGDEQTGRG